MTPPGRTCPPPVTLRERRAGDPPALSVVIPAFNERERLPQAIRQVAGYFRRPVEIVVADDGSRDGTAAVAETILADTPHPYAVIRHAHNHGKGCAARLGMLHARGRHRLIMDADCATPIDQWEKLRARLEAGADIAVGSRAAPGARITVAQPWHRRPLGPAFNLLVQAVLFGGIRDTQCGFKAYRAEAARDLFSRQRIDSFTFDPEILFLALRRGYRVEEVGVVWKDQPDSKVSVFRDSSRMLVDLLRIRMNSMRGDYDDRPSLSATSGRAARTLRP